MISIFATFKAELSFLLFLLLIVIVVFIFQQILWLSYFELDFSGYTNVLVPTQRFHKTTLVLVLKLYLRRQKMKTRLE